MRISIIGITIKTNALLHLVCSDSLPNPLRCFTKEDLEVEMIKKFGARIIKENMRLLPRHLGHQHTRIGTPTGSPLLRNMPLSHRDNFEETYPQAFNKTRNSGNECLIYCTG